jgi:HEAT repeat protein
MAALDALAALSAPNAALPASELLRDPDKKVRLQAAQTLKRLPPDARTVPALLEAIAEKDRPIRAASAAALGATKDPRAVGPLIALLKDPSQVIEVRQAACWGLTYSDSAEATDALAEALTKGLPAVRQTAALHLGKRGNNQAVAPLLEILRDAKQPGIRRAEAIKVLATLNDPRVGPALRLAAHDKDGDVRTAAQSAFATVTTKPAAPGR